MMDCATLAVNAVDEQVFDHHYFEAFKLFRFLNPQHSETAFADLTIEDRNWILEKARVKRANWK